MDTGCEITLVPRSLVDKHKLEIAPTKHRIWASNSTEIELSGETIIPFILNDRRIDTFALVSSDVEEVMIGVDWLKEHRCIWDFSGSQLFVDGRPTITLSRKQQLRCRRLYSEKRRSNTSPRAV